MGDDKQMECPECGEDAVSQAPSDLIPWHAHEMTQPAWSHKDGSSLCPVIGQSGGYEPARPRPRNADPAAETTRLDPPAAIQPAAQTGPAATSAPSRMPRGEPRTGCLPAGTAGVIGREHMKAVIARLDVLGCQALVRPAEREPEAGA